MPRFGILSTDSSTPCGLATFGAALADALTAKGADVTVVHLADDAAELLNRNDVAVVQHAYGGSDGEDVVDVLERLRVPSIVVAHTIVNSPTPQQYSTLERAMTLADHVVVMSEIARLRLSDAFPTLRHKVVRIPRGATLPQTAALKRSARPIILTWGFIGPGKGIERVIDAMAVLKKLPGNPRYVVAGRTHPRVLAAEGEAYRDACLARADQLGVADAVTFDAAYRSRAALTALILQASVVALPYDSTEQVTSGVLVDSVAAGRPIVATAFPHAVELLGSGAGLVVPHDDPDAMVSALHRVLTDPRVAGAMASQARQLAPTMAWPVVADAYLTAGRRLAALDTPSGGHHQAIVRR